MCGRWARCRRRRRYWRFDGGLARSRLPLRRGRAGRSTTAGGCCFAGDGVHHVEAVEGVFAVEERALVEVGEVVLGVVAGEGGAAEEDGDVDAAAR